MVIDIRAGAAATAGTALERERTGKLDPLARGLDPLYIEDPLSPDNNVGQSVFRIYQVQRVFEEASTLLEQALRRIAATPTPLCEVERQPSGPGLLASVLPHKSTR
jgi:DNA polymerase sigma